MWPKKISILMSKHQCLYTDMNPRILEVGKHAWESCALCSHPEQIYLLYLSSHCRLCIDRVRKEQMKSAFKNPPAPQQPDVQHFSYSVA